MKNITTCLGLFVASFNLIADSSCSSSTTGTPVVEWKDKPHVLYDRQGHAYVVKYVMDSNGVRTFSVDPLEKILGDDASLGPVTVVLPSPSPTKIEVSPADVK